MIIEWHYSWIIHDYSHDYHGLLMMSKAIILMGLLWDYHGDIMGQRDYCGIIVG